MMPIFTKGTNAKKAKQYSFKGYSFKDCKRIDLDFPEFYEHEEKDPDSAGTTDARSTPYDVDRWSPAFSDARFYDSYLSLTPSSLERSVSASAVGDILNAGTENIEKAGIENLEKAGVENLEKPAVFISAPVDLADSLRSVDAEVYADPQDPARPTGNIFGTIMHRALEILVKDIRAGADFKKDIRAKSAFYDSDESNDNNDSCIHAAILQAIMESGDEMENAFGSTYDRRVAEYRNFLTKILKKFASDEKLVDEIRRSKAVFTEYPFSFFTTEKADPEMFKALRQKISDKKAEKCLPSTLDQKVWIHGKADLVMMREDGSIHVLDYKSDMNTGLSEADFKEVIDRRYGGQMELYRYVCAKLFDTSIDRVYGDFYLID